MFKRILGGIFLFIFLSLAGFWGFVSTKYVVPILMYHSVTPDALPENMLAVTSGTLERQLRFLKAHHYNVIPLSSLADLIRQKKKIPRNTVVLTFDDGYKDNYTYAFPILKKYNLPATIFIIIQEVGRPDRLSWDEIKEMSSSGIISFGSHTLGPEPLIKIKSDAEVKRQIFESKRVLEEKLGQRVDMFSYPEGRFTPLIRQLVIDAGYNCAVTTKPGKKFPNDDVFALKRIRPTRDANNMFVFWFESSGRYLYLKEKK